MTNKFVAFLGMIAIAGVFTLMILIAVQKRPNEKTKEIIYTSFDMKDIARFSFDAGLKKGANRAMVNYIIYGTKNPHVEHLIWNDLKSDSVKFENIIIKNIK